MVFQELAALHQGNRVRVHFRDVLPRVLWQTHDAVRDSQFMFTHNLHATLAHQFVVVEQRACDGVFNRHHANHVRVLLHRLKHLLERVAADQFDVLVLEITVAGYIVVTSHLSLYGYSSHIIYNV